MILTQNWNDTQQLWLFDLNHVCMAFNEHTGVYVRFPPQEHVSETYDVCASYMLLYT